MRLIWPLILACDENAHSTWFAEIPERVTVLEMQVEFKKTKQKKRKKRQSNILMSYGKFQKSKYQVPGFSGLMSWDLCAWMLINNNKH